MRIVCVVSNDNTAKNHIWCYNPPHIAWSPLTSHIHRCSAGPGWGPVPVASLRPGRSDRDNARARTAPGSYSGPRRSGAEKNYWGPSGEYPCSSLVTLMLYFLSLAQTPQAWSRCGLSFWGWPRPCSSERTKWSGKTRWTSHTSLTSMRWILASYWQKGVTWPPTH